MLTISPILHSIKEKQYHIYNSCHCVPRENFSANSQLRNLQRKQTSQVRYWTDLKRKRDFGDTDLMLTCNNPSPSAQLMGPAHELRLWVQPIGPHHESIPAFPVCPMKLPCTWDYHKYIDTSPNTCTHTHFCKRLTLKAPRKTASENVVCLCRLLHLLANFSNLHFAYRQTVWTQIRKKQSDLGPHCLQQ